MSGWEVGDKAVCISSRSLCGFCDDDNTNEISEGAVVTVAAVGLSWFGGGTLEFAEVPPEPGAPWCECSFRKIRPDEHEACESEFVDLLKRSKQKEPANG